MSVKLTMQRTDMANIKFENLFWKSNASFLIAKFLIRIMNEAFNELEDAGQPLNPHKRFSGYYFVAWKLTVSKYGLLWALFVSDTWLTLTLPVSPYPEQCPPDLLSLILIVTSTVLKASTQRGVQQFMHPVHRWYSVDHLDLNRKRLNNTFYMDLKSDVDRRVHQRSVDYKWNVHEDLSFGVKSK